MVWAEVVAGSDLLVSSARSDPVVAQPAMSTSSGDGEDGAPHAVTRAGTGGTSTGPVSECSERLSAYLRCSSSG